MEYTKESQFEEGNDTKTYIPKSFNISHAVSCFYKTYSLRFGLVLDQTIGSTENFCALARVSVQGVVSLGGPFATFCLEFYLYKVKKNMF